MWGKREKSEGRGCKNYEFDLLFGCSLRLLPSFFLVNLRSYLLYSSERENLLNDVLIVGRIKKKKKMNKYMVLTINTILTYDNNYKLFANLYLFYLNKYFIYLVGFRYYIVDLDSGYEV